MAPVERQWQKYVHPPECCLESYEARPRFSAMLRALAMASAMLTEPLLVGLMPLRSTLPVLDGCGRYDAGGGGAFIMPDG
jgi:hypothetical protein